MNIPENGVVKPRGRLEIEIIFTPKEQKKYKEEVLFIINGTFNQKVTLTGHGYHLKVIGLQKNFIII